MADSHVGDGVGGLPERVAGLLAGVDLILHAGDVTDSATLAELRRIAPVVAVQGNHDELELPRAVLVRVGRHRIGLSHGHRPALVEIPAALATLASGRSLHLGFFRALRRRFREVDLVVFGHMHLPTDVVHGGVRYFSPGAVYVPELDPGFDWSGRRGRAYRLLRARFPHARVAGVGLIEASRAELRARIVPLARPRPQ